MNPNVVKSDHVYTPNMDDYNKYFKSTKIQWDSSIPDITLPYKFNFTTLKCTNKNVTTTYICNFDVSPKFGFDSFSYDTKTYGSREYKINYFINNLTPTTHLLQYMVIDFIRKFMTHRLGLADEPILAQTMAMFYNPHIKLENMKYPYSHYITSLNGWYFTTSPHYITFWNLYKPLINSPFKTQWFGASWLNIDNLSTKMIDGILKNMDPEEYKFNAMYMYDEEITHGPQFDMINMCKNGSICCIYKKFDDFGYGFVRLTRLAKFDVKSNLIQILIEKFIMLRKPNVSRNIGITFIENLYNLFCNSYNGQKAILYVDTIDDIPGSHEFWYSLSQQNYIVLTNNALSQIKSQQQQQYLSIKPMPQFIKYLT